MTDGVSVLERSSGVEKVMQLLNALGTQCNVICYSVECSITSIFLSLQILACGLDASLTKHDLELYANGAHSMAPVY